MIPSGVIEVRRDACAECPTPCEAIRDGLVDPAHPCAACPIGTWGRYSDMGCDDRLDRPAMPSASALARNLMTAVAGEAAAVLAGAPPLQANEARRRLAICRACPSGLHRLERGHDRCSRCGCYLAAKTAWRSQSCPVGHW